MKRFAPMCLGASGMVLLAGAAAAQPVNDECASAEVVFAGITHFNNAIATTSAGYSNSCAAEAAKDVWFSYTAPNSGAVIIDTCGSSFRTAISVYNACNSEEIMCGNNWVDCSNVYNSRVSVSMNNGQTVLIRVSGEDEYEAGDGVINIAGPVDAPPNDECNNAQVLASGDIETVDTTRATRSLGDGISCGESYFYNGITGSDVWYEFTAGVAGTVRLEVDYSFTLSMAVYTSCGGAEISCTNNFSGDPYIDVPMEAGQSITIRIAGQDGDNGVGTFRIRGPVQLPVVNDTCAGAAPLVAGIYPFDLTFSTADPVISCNTTSFISQAPTVWYSTHIDQPEAGTRTELFVHACAEGVNPLSQIAIFDQDCNGSILSCALSNCRNSSYGAAAYVTNNRNVVFSLGTRDGFSSVQLSGSLFVVTTAVSVWDEAVDGEEDSSNIPAFAQAAAGSGILDRIVGNFDSSYDVDVYKIQICNKDLFSASMVPTESFPGFVQPASMFLFDEDGVGIVYNNNANDGTQSSELTNQYVLENGVYYLAVSSGNLPTSAGVLIWNYFNGTGEFPPSGPGANGVVDNWGTNFAQVGDNTVYRIALTGVCRADTPLPCAADFNHVNGVTVQDIFDFLTAWLAGNPSADFNHVNGVTVQDIFDFLTAWLAGC